MKAKVTTIALLSVLTGSAFATEPVAEFTGRTLVDEKSRAEAVDLISRFFFTTERNRRCPLVVVKANPSQKPASKGDVIEEKWTATGCQQVKNYDVTFIPNPMGSGYLTSLNDKSIK